MLSISCMSKTNSTLISSNEYLDIFMPMHNLLEYSGNYFMASGSLCNYDRDELDDDANENNANNYRIDNIKATASRSFEYDTKIIGSIQADNNTLDTEVIVLLKHFSNSPKIS